MPDKIALRAFQIIYKNSPYPGVDANDEVVMRDSFHIAGEGYLWETVIDGDTGLEFFAELEKNGWMTEICDHNRLHAETSITVSPDICVFLRLQGWIGIDTLTEYPHVAAVTSALPKPID